VIAFAAVVAVATLAVGLVAALAVGRLPSLRGRLTGLALFAVLLPLAAVVLSGVVMFQSEHDLTVLAVGAASSTASLIAALLLARAITAPIDALGSAATKLAHGDLESRAPVSGPTELQHLAASFNEMAARLEELFDARRELVAWASHDLRTPLAALQAMVEAVEDGLVDDNRYVPAMRDQVHALSALVDDLFELARIDAGALTLEVREAKVERLVESCVRGLEAEAKARRVRLEARIHDDVPVVRCAPDKVERVLYNLVLNALRHTPSDGSVAVLVQPAAEEVRITVEDTGDGIPAEALRRIFDRFWRGEPSRPPGGGAGLGLAIARGLVEAHGGRIWAENRSAGGARVSFTLPAG
jgi:signal transduction histidine kinase